MSAFTSFARLGKHPTASTMKGGGSLDVRLQTSQSHEQLLRFLSLTVSAAGTAHNGGPAAGSPEFLAQRTDYFARGVSPTRVGTALVRIRHRRLPCKWWNRYTYGRSHSTSKEERCRECRKRHRRRRQGR